MTFGVSRSTVYRIIGRFLATRRASSLVPADRGTPRGAKRVDSRVERVIAEQINRVWLKKEKPNMRALIERVHEACRIDGLRLPHRSTIQRRVDELNVLRSARKRGEAALEAAATPSAGNYRADKPNEIWQIDHTIVDMIVVDEETRLPIGRPVLTIAIDLCTRMVAGFYLSLDPPSSVSVGLCLLHAVYDKTLWLQERNIDYPWPVAGIPSDAREAIAGDTQLARRLDQIALPRWKADEEFQGLVVGILRSLPLRRPSALSAQSLRTLARATDGITAKVFSMLNELAVEAVHSGSEQITDDDVERNRCSQATSLIPTGGA